MAPEVIAYREGCAPHGRPPEEVTAGTREMLRLAHADNPGQRADRAVRRKASRGAIVYGFAAYAARRKRRA